MTGIDNIDIDHALIGICKSNKGKGLQLPVRH